MTHALVDALGLRPHPEGGYYREVWRSDAATAIHFLLPAGAFSALHRVRSSDEVWTFFDGDPLELWTLDSGAGAEPKLSILGRDVAAGQRPIAVVPAGVLQAAVPRGASYSWCGCVVAPAFTFAEFEMPSRNELLGAHPEHAEFVRRFTR